MSETPTPPAEAAPAPAPVEYVTKAEFASLRTEVGEIKGCMTSTKDELLKAIATLTAPPAAKPEPPAPAPAPVVEKVERRGITPPANAANVSLKDILDRTMHPQGIKADNAEGYLTPEQAIAALGGVQ